MSESNQYILREFKEPDRIKLLPFLEKDYNRHEPLQMLYQAKHAERMSVQESRDLADYLWHRHEAMSAELQGYVIQTSNGDLDDFELAGVVLFHPEENPRIPSDVKSDVLEKLRLLPEDSCRPVLDIFKNVTFPAMDRAKIFERFPEAWMAVNVQLLCVAEEHRGKKLSSILMKNVVFWAKKYYFDVVYGLFTSEYAQKAADKAGLKSVEAMDLASFKDGEGQPIYEGMEGRFISIMAYDLDGEKKKMMMSGQTF